VFAKRVFLFPDLVYIVIILILGFFSEWRWVLSVGFCFWFFFLCGPVTLCSGCLSQSFNRNTLGLCLCALSRNGGSFGCEEARWERMVEPLNTHHPMRALVGMQRDVLVLEFRSVVFVLRLLCFSFTISSFWQLQGRIAALWGIELPDCAKNESSNLLFCRVASMVLFLR
jgi:hypothetical protein